jgi:hypothetical protein
MYIYWINRNDKYTEDKREYTGSLLRHGEVHWRYDASDAGYARNSHTGSLSWNWGQSFCGVEVELGGGDGNNEAQLFLGIPYVLSLWFHHTLPPWIVTRLPQHHYRVPVWKQPRTPDAVPELDFYDEGSYPEKRNTGVRIHNWALWWNVWHNDDEWHSTDPWYRRGSLQFPDLLFGRREYRNEKLGPPIRTHVQMAEGAYPVTVQQQRETWWRTRWPWWPCRIDKVLFAVNCDVGIPFPGKGTTAYNCGDDALHGTAFAVSTVEDACAKFRAAVLEYRRRYGGQRCAEEPWPQAAADYIRDTEARRSANAQQQAPALLPRQERTP